MRINEDFLDKINASDLEQELNVVQTEDDSTTSSEWLDYIKQSGDYYLTFIYTRPVNEKINGYETVFDICKKTTSFLNKLLKNTPIQNSGLKIFATQQTLNAYLELAEQYNWSLDDKKLRDITLREFRDADRGLTWTFAIKRFDRLYDFLVLLSSLYTLCTMKLAPHSLYVKFHWAFLKYPFSDDKIDIHWHDNKYPLLKCREFIEPKMRYNEMNPNFSMLEVKKFIQVLSEREQDCDDYADWLTDEFQKLIDHRNAEFAQKKYYENALTGNVTTPLYEDAFDKISIEDIDDSDNDTENIEETDECFEKRCLDAGYTNYTVWIIKGLHREMSPEKIIKNIRALKQRTERMLDGFFNEHTPVSVIIPENHIYVIDFLKSGLFGFDKNFREIDFVTDDNAIVLRFAFTPDSSASIAETVRFLYTYHHIDSSPLVNSNNGRYYINASNYIRNDRPMWVPCRNINIRVVCDLFNNDSKSLTPSSLVLVATTIVNLQLSSDLYKNNPDDAKKIIRRELESYFNQKRGIKNV